MAKKSQYYDEAERLFVMQNRGIAEIAGLLPVSETSLYKWSDAGEWVSKRRARLRTSRGAAEILRDKLEEKVSQLTAEELDSKTSDEIVKIAVAVEKLERGSVSLMAAAVEVMSRFSVFVRQNVKDPERLREMSGLIQTFFEEIEA